MVVGFGSGCCCPFYSSGRWIISDPFKRAIERYTRRPDYAEQLGFTSEADRDIRCLTNVIAGNGDRALAVFVDDLDRCSPEHVVEVIEAINQIFNSAEGRRCVFFLGMDREVVAASIEVAYSDTVQHLRERNSARAEGYGLQFLSKIVQMSLSFSTPDITDVQALLAQLTGNPIPTRTPTPSSQSEEEVQRFQAQIEDRQPVNPGDVASAVQEVSATSALTDPQRDALAEAARRARAKRFGVDAPDVAAAEFEVLRYLPPNPRQIKRFDNAFRLQLHVANSEGVAAELPARPTCGAREVDRPPAAMARSSRGNR